MAAQAVSRVYSDFLSGNVAAVLAALSPNVTWTLGGYQNSPFQHEYRGREGVQEFFAILDASETVVKFDVAKVIASGNNAVAFIDWSATVKATGKTYSTGMVHDWTVDDSGALVSFTEYFSDGPAMSAAYVS